jgi:hypothetical protein
LSKLLFIVVIRNYTRPNIAAAAKAKNDTPRSRGAASILFARPVCVFFALALVLVELDFLVEVVVVASLFSSDEVDELVEVVYID